MLDAKNIVQAVSDNFDTNIFPQNGLLSTHSLALLLTQVQNVKSSQAMYNKTIPRITKDDMRDQVIVDVPVKRVN